MNAEDGLRSKGVNFGAYCASYGGYKADALEAYLRQEYVATKRVELRAETERHEALLGPKGET